MLLLIGIALFLPQLYATPVNHTTRTHEAKSTYLAPEKIERIAQKLLKLTLNTTHVQTSHCIMHPDTALQKDRKIHFHFNVISDVFIDMPIFVRKNITINLLKSVLQHAENYDLSLDCWSTDERPEGFHVDDLEHLKPYAFGEHVIQDIMEDEFNKTFMPEFFYVENVCEHYGLDRGQESHFQILVVSDKFINKSVSQRRLMVDEIVRRTMMHGIVRLFLKLYTKKEYDDEMQRQREKKYRPHRKAYDELRNLYDMEA